MLKNSLKIPKGNQLVCGIFF